MSCEWTLSFLCSLPYRYGSCPRLFQFCFQADKAVAEEKLEAARPALEEAEAALQV